MKNLIPLAFVAGAAAGALAGGLTTVFVGGPSSEAGVESLAVDAGPDSALIDRLDGLADEVAGLAERVTFVEQRPAVAQAPARVPVEGLDPETAKVADELADLAAALRNPDGARMPANFQETVSRALDNIREQEDRERDEQRAIARAEALEQRLQRISDELELVPYQVDEFRKIYTDRDARMSEARELMRDGGGDWTSAREAFRTIRDESESAISNLLTPEQNEKYQEMDDRGGFGRGGGGRGR